MSKQITCEKCNKLYHPNDLEIDAPTGEWWCPDCKPRTWKQYNEQSRDSK